MPPGVAESCQLQAELAIGPAAGADADKPLRRQVAMAYRAAREAMLSHEDAIDAAEAVYFEAHPEAMADRLAASARVSEMVAAAFNVHLKWLWKNAAP
jgi:hypothetical protein